MAGCRPYRAAFVMILISHDSVASPPHTVPTCAGSPCANSNGLATRSLAESEAAQARWSMKARVDHLERCLRQPPREPTHERSRGRRAIRSGGVAFPRANQLYAPTTDQNSAIGM